MLNHPVQYELHICIDTDHPQYDDLKQYYENVKCHFEGDSGLDLINPRLPEVGVAQFQLQTIDFGIKCAMFGTFYDAQIGLHKTVPSAFFLLPRSSFSSTGYIMANSVGLIDSGYRGNLKAKVINLIENNPNLLASGGRFFQIAAPNLQPMLILVVDSLPPSERGSGGFGSTGK